MTNAREVMEFLNGITWNEADVATTEVVQKLRTPEGEINPDSIMDALLETEKTHPVLVEIPDLLEGALRKYGADVHTAADMANGGAIVLSVLMRCLETQADAS